LKSINSGLYHLWYYFPGTQVQPGKRDSGNKSFLNRPIAQIINNNNDNNNNNVSQQSTVTTTTTNFQTWLNKIKYKTNLSKITPTNQQPTNRRHVITTPCRVHPKDISHILFSLKIILCWTFYTWYCTQTTKSTSKKLVELISVFGEILLRICKASYASTASLILLASQFHLVH
jgi:hypothetical protein